jgi:hypothetical protein
MKKLLCLLLLAGYSFIGHGQNIPSYVPTNGLVAWYPFNGNANDESGNGNNGTVNGATIVTDRFGNFNSCFSFDGINDYLSIPYKHSLSPANGSVSYWMKTNGRVNNLQHTYGQGYGRPGMGLSPDNHLHKSVLAWSTASGQFPYVVSISDVDSSNWVFVVGIYSTTDFKIYINGVLENVSSTTLSQYYCDAPIQIGGYNYPSYCGFGPYSGQFFNGFIDDIAVFNRALTQQEITNLYNASLPPACPSLPSNLQSGLVGYWPFCGNANDESGNGNHGTVNGATLTTDRFGDSGRAYSFDGVNDAIDFQPGSNNSLNVVGNISISLFIKTSQTTTGTVMSFGEHNGPENGYLLSFLNNGNQQNGQIGYHYSDPWYFSKKVLNDGLWHQVVIVHSNPKVFIYVDGIIDTSVNITSNVLSWNGQRKLGVRNDLSIEYFNGLLDDIIIWNRALTQQEATQLYKTQSSNLSEGNVGVNVAAPQRSLHIKDVIRLEPRNTAPENPVRGDMYYDGILNKLRVYDGTTWQNCW